MSEQHIKVKANVEYAGHSQKPNGSVDLTFKLNYSQLTQAIETLQLLNNDVTVKAKIDKVVKLGVFRVQNVNIDHDGESKVKFNGISDYINMDSLNILPLNTADNKEFTILMEASVEV